MRTSFLARTATRGGTKSDSPRSTAISRASISASFTWRALIEEGSFSREKYVRALTSKSRAISACVRPSRLRKAAKSKVASELILNVLKFPMTGVGLGIAPTAFKHDGEGKRKSLAPRLQFPRRRRVPPHQVGHIEPGNLAILHHPAAPDHHAVGAMRPAQYKRREWIAAAGKPQLVEPKQREVGQHADGDLADIGAPGARRRSLWSPSAARRRD